MGFVLWASNQRNKCLVFPLFTPELCKRKSKGRLKLVVATVRNAGKKTPTTQECATSYMPKKHMI